MLLTGGDIDHCTHVAYLSLVNRLANSVYWYDLKLNGGQPIAIDKSGNPISGNDPENDSNFLGYWVTDDSYGLSVDNSDSSIKYITVDNLVYNAAGNIVTNMNQLITAPPSPQNERYYIKKDGQEITVLGYHFEQNTTMTVPGDNNTDTESTTIVRVNCKYDNSGGYTVTLDHVAPIEAAAANYIHEITLDNGTDQLTGVTFIDNSENEDITDDNTPFTGTGSCSNSATIKLSTITIDPLGVVQGGTYTSNAVQMAVNRSFTLNMKAAFVQASTLPGS